MNNIITLIIFLEKDTYCAKKIRLKFYDIRKIEVDFLEMFKRLSR